MGQAPALPQCPIDSVAFLNRRRGVDDLISFYDTLDTNQRDFLNKFERSFVWVLRGAFAWRADFYGARGAQN